MAYVFKKQVDSNKLPPTISALKEKLAELITLVFSGSYQILVIHQSRILMIMAGVSMKPGESMSLYSPVEFLLNLKLIANVSCLVSLERQFNVD